MVKAQGFDATSQREIQQERVFSDASRYTRRDEIENLKNLLKQHGYKYIDQLQDFNGITLLMVAASQSREMDTLKAIVELCKDVNHCDSLGRNALHYAAAAKNFLFVRYLASEEVGVDIDK